MHLRQAATAAFDKGAAKMRLKAADLLADRGMGHADAGPGLIKGFGLGKGEKGAQGRERWEGAPVDHESPSYMWKEFPPCRMRIFGVYSSHTQTDRRL